MHRSTTAARAGIFAIAGSLCLVGPASAASYVTFEVPNCNGFTIPSAINSADTVAGTCDYGTSGGISFGFVRTANGTITNFAADPNTATTAVAINERGTIIGTAHDSIYHGYLRDPSGTFTLFDAPAAISTNPASINKLGTITGSFTDSQLFVHGFVRDAHGKMRTFDVPGKQPPFVTSPTSMNDEGTIAGFTLDANEMYHGFVRTPDGTISSFDVPGFQVTFAGGINNDGAIVGLCGSSQILSDLIGFVRAADGKFETFTGRHGGAGMTQIAINKNGEVVTSYIDPKSRVGRGLIRNKNGKIKVFDVNGAGTYAYAINARGDVTGYLNNGSDGFIRLH